MTTTMRIDLTRLARLMLEMTLREMYCCGFLAAVQAMQDLTLAGGLDAAEASNVCMDHYRLALRDWVAAGGPAPVLVRARLRRMEPEEIEELPFAEEVAEQGAV